MPGAMRRIRMKEHADGYMAGEVVEVSQSQARRLISLGAALDMQGDGLFQPQVDKMVGAENVK